MTCKNLKISEKVHKMVAIEARIQDKNIGVFAEELIIAGLISQSKKLIEDQETEKSYLNKKKFDGRKIK